MTFSKLAFCLFLLVTLLSYCLSCMSSNSASPAVLSIVKQELKKDETCAVAYITVKNTGRTVAELAEVIIEFRDAEKNLVASSSDSVMNLGPNETWDFVIKCSGDRCVEVTSCDIKTMSGMSSGRY